MRIRIHLDPSVFARIRIRIFVGSGSAEQNADPDMQKKMRIWMQAKTGFP